MTLIILNIFNENFVMTLHSALEHNEISLFLHDFFFEKYFTKKYNNYMYMCKLSAKIFFTRIVAITDSWQSCLKLPSRKFEDSIMKKEYRHQLPQIRKPSDSSVYYQSATDFLLEMSHTK